MKAPNRNEPHAKQYKTHPQRTGTNQNEPQRTAMNRNEYDMMRTDLY